MSTGKTPLDRFSGLTWDDREAWAGGKIVSRGRNYQRQGRLVYEFVHALNQGESLAKVRTIAVTVMVFFQFFQAWNSRSEIQSVFRINPFSNPFLFLGLIAAFGAHLAEVYVPSLQWLFRTEPIAMMEWLRILGISVTVLIMVEIDKWLRRMKTPAHA